MGDINCRNCEAACCKALQTMNLTPEEAAFLREAGTNLYMAGPFDDDPGKEPPPIKMDVLKSVVYVDAEDAEHMRAAGLARYILLSDKCAYLQTDPGGWQYCGAYDNEGRPQACRNFQIAGPACSVVRFVHGIDQADAGFDLRNGL